MMNPARLAYNKNVSFSANLFLSNGISLLKWISWYAVDNHSFILSSLPDGAVRCFFFRALATLFF